MLTIQIDVSDVKRQWAQEVRNLERGAESATMEAANAGKAAARVRAPHKSYALRNSIDAQAVSAGPDGAEADLAADAEYASFLRDGTRPHPIEARRKRFLRWVGPAGERFARRVNHPGTKPNSFWVDALEVVELRLVRAGQNVADGVASRMNS